MCYRRKASCFPPDEMQDISLIPFPASPGEGSDKGITARNRTTGNAHLTLNPGGGGNVTTLVANHPRVTIMFFSPTNSSTPNLFRYLRKLPWKPHQMDLAALLRSIIHTSDGSLRMLPYFSTNCAME